MENGSITRERERERVKWFRHIYNIIISMENLLASWQEFLRGKRKRKDVAEFSLNFLDNIIVLYNDLADRSYRHGGYQAFKINDPKPRNIHKACVRDRLVHHAIYRILYPIFDQKFIHDSYSCRIVKGTHRAIDRFRSYGRIVSKNYTRTCWILKCDIRKFFASVDHRILVGILSKHIQDADTIWLLKQVIGSFETKCKSSKGMPLGNLTSQLFANIYLNELDQFIKRELKARYYIRYADDFVLFSESKKWLFGLIDRIREFLQDKLKLELHSGKIFIQTLNSGIDFLGWVHFPHQRILRTKTKKRMLKRLSKTVSKESCASYLGLLSHGNTHLLQKIIINISSLEQSVEDTIFPLLN